MLVSPLEIRSIRSVFGIPITTKIIIKKQFSHFKRADYKGVNDKVFYKVIACERGVCGKGAIEVLVAEGLEAKAEASAIQKIYKEAIG